MGAVVGQARWAPLVALLVLTGCGADEACEQPATTAACADLTFDGRSYYEWRPVNVPTTQGMQEVGDANYPACNSSDCDADGVGDRGATDVWLVEGVDLTDALLGLREDSDTYVIFVRKGVEQESLRSRIEPSLLE